MAAAGCTLALARELRLESATLEDVSLLLEARTMGAFAPAPVPTGDTVRDIAALPCA